MTALRKSDSAVIHFETRRDSKTRWVKQAQREGMELKAWVEKTLNGASRPLELGDDNRNINHQKNPPL